MKNHTALLIFALLLAMPAAFAQRNIDSVLNRKPAKIQYGTASFYAGKFQGRKTAIGEPYDQNKMTCAHNSLPLGTWVKVTNLRNHKFVYVRVTDRLHHRNRRLVDLSRAAAAKLGYLKRGLTRVKVEVLSKKPPVTREKSLK
jgi:rare lipoprotein A